MREKKGKWVSTTKHKGSGGRGERERGERNPADKDRNFCCAALPCPVAPASQAPTRNRARKKSRKSHGRNGILDGGERTEGSSGGKG
jgi:hypothetical protein